ncbi:hypothetical protein B0H15DRAFT_615691 [Mycena belliarum]|uniref:Uncharacterized protein n=1 Tax=Mycena belliarum TaxID=1033014 RepID=A0AAD6TS65_9AGAR|nr:hypothetical protein B0H15DRAFT_615691 [Mycena belliae]
MGCASPRIVARRLYIGAVSIRSSASCRDTAWRDDVGPPASRRRGTPDLLDMGDPNSEIPASSPSLRQHQYRLADYTYNQGDSSENLSDGAYADDLASTLTPLQTSLPISRFSELSHWNGSPPAIAPARVPVPPLLVGMFSEHAPPVSRDTPQTAASNSANSPTLSLFSPTDSGPFNNVFPIDSFWHEYQDAPDSDFANDRLGALNDPTPTFLSGTCDKSLTLPQYDYRPAFELPGTAPDSSQQISFPEIGLLEGSLNNPNAISASDLARSLSSDAAGMARPYGGSDHWSYRQFVSDYDAARMSFSTSAPSASQLPDESDQTISLSVLTLLSKYRSRAWLMGT